MNKIYLLLTSFIIFIFNPCNGQNIESLLEKAFYNTFSSSQEFKACRVFQLLGYDLAETDMIANITPYPKNIKLQADYKTSLNEDSENKLAFSSITAVCDKVHYYGMTIERVSFCFPNCVLDRKKLEAGSLRFLEADEIHLDVMVSESDILSVFDLFARATNLTKMKMELNNDLCHLKGRVKMGFFLAEFEVTGSVNLSNSKQIDFVCTKLVINKQIQPRNFISTIFSQINPVFDSTKTWINLNISDIKMSSGFVVTKAVINRKTL